MTFVPLHHVRKGTRLSPSLLFIVVVRGEPGNEATHSQSPWLNMHCSTELSHSIGNGPVLAVHVGMPDGIS